MGSPSQGLPRQQQRRSLPARSLRRDGPPRSSAMPSNTLRRNPSRDVKEAMTKVAKRSSHPANPEHAKTTNPSSAPSIAPDSETVRSRQASPAMSTLTTRAGAKASAMPGHADHHASPVTRLPPHSTEAAAAGTLMLSSSRTGIVSTSAAAATTGAMRPNASGGNGVMAGRTQSASRTPATDPVTTNVTVPAIVLLRFR